MALVANRICAWCQRVLEHDASGLTADSHGICPPCQDKLLAEAEAQPVEGLTTNVGAIRFEEFAA